MSVSARSDFSRLLDAVGVMLEPHLVDHPLTVDFDGAPLQITVRGVAADAPADVRALADVYEQIISAGALAGGPAAPRLSRQAS